MKVLLFAIIAVAAIMLFSGLILGFVAVSGGLLLFIGKWVVILAAIVIVGRWLVKESIRLLW